MSRSTQSLPAMCLSSRGQPLQGQLATTGCVSTGGYYVGLLQVPHSPSLCQQVLFKVMVSHPDLFHLSLWLSPPPSSCHPSSQLSPVYLYLCFLFVCCQFVLFVKSTSGFVSQLLIFPVSLFSPSRFWLLPVLTLSPTAWPLCLPLSLPADLYLWPTSGLLTPACLNLYCLPQLDY
jgi:hypothetical protein